MILWMVLFVLVLGLSFVLALKSMRDYQQIPGQSGQDFSLFLIQNSQALNEQFFNSLNADLLQSELSISFERLFKGKKSALVVFGSNRLLIKYKAALNLLELEDYTDIDTSQVSAWEIGVKERQQAVFKNLPELEDTEQFWWQTILWVNKDKPNYFQYQIRAVVISNNAQNLLPEYFFKLPKAFSNSQIIDFYKKRSFTKISKNPLLNWAQVWQLVSPS